ncbi:MAG TPA: hypothetical protein VGD66_05985 [Allosphingosinicella sp.]|jgi:hypothetical protein
MTTAATHVIDLTPITSALMQVLAAVVLGIGTFAAQRVVQWLGLRNSQAVTAALDSALQKAVTYGLQQSHDLIKQNGWDHVSVRNNSIAEAATYMTSRFQDTLKAAGVDVNDSAGTQAIVEGALQRAFPHAAAVAAASPATPPTTAPNPKEQKDLPQQQATQVTEVQA